MISTVLRQGQGMMNEDALIINHHAQLFGVIDGVTSYGQLIDGRTPGRIAADTVKHCFENADVQLTLHQMTSLANSAIAEEMERLNHHISHPKDRFQCCHSVVKVNDHTIDWTSSADCVIYAVGSHVEQIIPSFDKTKEKQRFQYWQSRYPNTDQPPRAMIEAVAVAQSTANRPNGYSVMNGDPAFNQFFNHGTLLKQDIDYILLTTDGFYDIESIGLEAFIHKAVSPLDDWADYIQYHETLDKERTLYPRAKVYDDKAAVLIKL